MKPTEGGKWFGLLEITTTKMGLGWRRDILREPAAVIIHQMELAFALAKCEEQMRGNVLLVRRCFFSSID